MYHMIISAELGTWFLVAETDDEIFLAKWVVNFSNNWYFNVKFSMKKILAHESQSWEEDIRKRSLFKEKKN